MKKNMGFADRAIRAIIAVAIGVFYYYHIISGAFGIGLLVVSAIFLVTSILGYCPIYALLGIHSRHSEKKFF